MPQEITKINQARIEASGTCGKGLRNCSNKL